MTLSILCLTVAAFAASPVFACGSKGAKDKAASCCSKDKGTATASKDGATCEHAKDKKVAAEKPAEAPASPSTDAKQSSPGKG
jgi:hypothetical protein